MKLLHFMKKKDFKDLLKERLMQIKKFFKNKEVINKKHIQSLNRLQLPKNLAYALSVNYDKASFTKKSS